MNGKRPWLGGVCAYLADKLHWNVIGLRVAILVLAWLAPLMTVAVYLVATLALRSNGLGSGFFKRSGDPQMDEWDRRMSDINRRYRKY